MMQPHRRKIQRKNSFGSVKSFGGENDLMNDIVVSTGGLLKLRRRAGECLNPRLAFDYI
jgi:hypothetical protein